VAGDRADREQWREGRVKLGGLISASGGASAAAQVRGSGDLSCISQALLGERLHGRGAAAAHVVSDSRSSSGLTTLTRARWKMGGATAAGAHLAACPGSCAAAAVVRSAHRGSCCAMEAGWLEPFRRPMYRTSGDRSANVVVRRGRCTKTCIVRARREDGGGRSALESLLGI